MPKDLVYRVKIVPADASGKQLSQDLERGQERAQEATRDTISEINREISQLELLEKTGRKSTAELSEAIERLNKDLATAPQQTQKVIRAQKRLVSLQDRLGDSFQRTAGSSRAMRNTISGANQTLFSFGDIINDAQQFQFGFASGSRAIGNNIAFMSEQFANVANRAGGFTGALKAMGASLLGPGGIILGINIAVTALTIFGDKLFSAGKQAKLTKEELDDLTSTITDFTDELESRGFFGDDPFNIKQIRFQQRTLNEVLKETQQAQKNILTQAQEEELARLKARKEAQTSNVIRMDALDNQRALTQAEKTRLQFLQGLRQEQESFTPIIEKLRKEQSDISEELRTQLLLQEKVNELEAQRFARLQERMQAQLQVDLPEREFTVFGTFETAEREQFLRNLEEIGVTETEFMQELANKEVNIHRKKEEAKTLLTRLQSNARKQLISQAIGASTAIIEAAFGKSKAVRIATTLLDTFASAHAAFASQLVPGDPTSLARAKIAAAFALAQGLARVATMRQITPETQSAGGAGGGAGPGPEGFTRGEIPPAESRNVTNLVQRPQQPVVINVRGDIDDRMVSIRAERGDKRRRSGGITVKTAR